MNMRRLFPALSHYVRADLPEGEWVPCVAFDIRDQVKFKTVLETYKQNGKWVIVETKWNE